MVKYYITLLVLDILIILAFAYLLDLSIIKAFLLNTLINVNCWYVMKYKK